MGEVGGLNLYGFVGNNGVNQWDILGLMKYEFRLNKDTGLDLSWAGGTGEFGQPGKNTKNVFASGDRSAISLTGVFGNPTVWQAGDASCNSIVDGTCPATEGGAIYVYAIPESDSEKNCKWEFNLYAQLNITKRRFKGGMGGGSGTAKTYKDGLETIFVQVNPGETFGEGDGKTQACIKGKTLIGSISSSLRVSTVGASVISTAYIRVNSEKILGPCK